MLSVLPIPGAGLIGQAVGLANRFSTPASPSPVRPARRATRLMARGIIPGQIARGSPVFNIPSAFDSPTTSSIFAQRGVGGGSLVRNIGAVLGRVFSSTGKLLRVKLPSGASVNRKGMVKLAKQVGLEAAAVALGITAVELAGVIAEEASKRPRRRGITAAQLRNARSTNRKILSMAKSLGFACRPTAKVGK